MGAWGTAVFEDDTALDFMDEQLVPATDPRRVMREAFEAALAAEYVDYEAGHAVLVSAAAMQALFRGAPLHDDEPDAWAAWRRANARLDVSNLGPLAGKACLKVAGPASELHELWAENEALFPAWRAGVETLASAVAG
ncbi:DUF4259 domain-containing protein [Dyella sp.]|jgi:hypothetical protein|uniref:DUF4259 domain-containing protein n=1 Tax=Dyella sp. TaxID=1869338 RepID=UPI002D791145|nr:DUF4259 domain-containing protein [Dyella sp.]HET6431113.1 DUF4259 domain-containing protein [Dyella sp.]